MQTTIEYLDAVKARLSLSSDYALAKELGVTRSCISKLRKGNEAMSDSTAIEVAKRLNIEPAMAIASAHSERAKKPEERAAWELILERLGGVAAALVLGLGAVTAPSPAQAAMTPSFDNNADGMHIMRNTKGRRQRKNSMLLPFFLGRRMAPL